jgi:hypothetical protein
MGPGTLAARDASKSRGRSVVDERPCLALLRRSDHRLQWDEAPGVPCFIASAAGSGSPGLRLWSTW